MRWLCALILVSMGAAGFACGADTSTQERQPNAPIPSRAATGEPAAIAVPQNAVDRKIRRDLNQLIADDPDLRSRQISFIVSNGDISVTGLVHTEDERKKMNDLAMNIEGVKSVANNLRVAE